MFIQYLTETSGAVDWDIFLIHRYQVPRIDISFSVAPTSAGSVYVYRVNEAGSVLLREVNPVGLTAVNIEGLLGFQPGDVVNVVYANPDAVTINGSADVDSQSIKTAQLDGFYADDGILRSFDANNWRIQVSNLRGVGLGSNIPVYEPMTAARAGGMRFDDPDHVIESNFRIGYDWEPTNDNVALIACVTLPAATTADVLGFDFIVGTHQMGKPFRQFTFSLLSPTPLTLPADTMILAVRRVDYDEGEILPGDMFCLNCRLSVDPSVTINDVIFNYAAVTYPTTHVQHEFEDFALTIY